MRGGAGVLDEDLPPTSRAYTSGIALHNRSLLDRTQYRTETTERRIPLDGGQGGILVLDAEARVTGVRLSQIAVEGPIAESNAVARRTVVDVGKADGAMTIDLATAQREPLKVDPASLSFKPPADEVLLMGRSAQTGSQRRGAER